MHEMWRAKMPLGFGEAKELLFAVADEAVAPLSASEEMLIGPKLGERVRRTRRQSGKNSSRETPTEQPSCGFHRGNEIKPGDPRDNGGANHRSVH
jgi:hypothetical protein